VVEGVTEDCPQAPRGDNIPKTVKIPVILSLRGIGMSVAKLLDFLAVRQDGQTFQQRLPSVLTKKTRNPFPPLS
jgi:hypothetical protein